MISRGAAGFCSSAACRHHVVCVSRNSRGASRNTTTVVRGSHLGEILEVVILCVVASSHHKHDGTLVAGAATRRPCACACARASARRRSAPSNGRSRYLHTTRKPSSDANGSVGPRSCGGTPWDRASRRPQLLHANWGTRTQHTRVSWTTTEQHTGCTCSVVLTSLTAQPQSAASQATGRATARNS